MTAVKKLSCQNLVVVLLIRSVMQKKTWFPINLHRLFVQDNKKRCSDSNGSSNVVPRGFRSVSQLNEVKSALLVSVSAYLPGDIHNLYAREREREREIEASKRVIPVE